VPARRAPKKIQAAGQWQISRITGKKAFSLGHVEAPDATTAIKTAIRKFDIEPHLQHRIMARPIVSA
jgi:hypothetical protein